MAYQLEFIQEQQILKWTILEGFKVSHDLPTVVSDAQALLNELSHDVYYFADARKLKMDFSGVVFALGMLAKGQMALFKHPRIIKIVAVGHGDLIEFAFKALEQAQYGHLRVEFHHDSESALDSIQREFAVV